MKNDKALIVAERMIDFYFKKKQKENLKRYQWIQRKNTLKEKKKNLIDYTAKGYTKRLVKNAIAKEEEICRHQKI